MDSFNFRSRIKDDRRNVVLRKKRRHSLFDHLKPAAHLRRNHNSKARRRRKSKENK